MRTAALGTAGLAAWALLSLSTGCQVSEDTPAVVAGTGGTTSGPSSQPENGSGGSSASDSDSDAGADSGFDLSSGDAPEEAAMKIPTAGSGGTSGGPGDLIPPSGDASAPPPPGYAGRPWDEMPQSIPGTIHCALYDLGGEGVAYHDADSANQGTLQANLDPNAPEARFRMAEGVDLGATRPGRDRYTTGMEVQAQQLYVGWTQPGEWVNYTVTVDQPGLYTVSTLLSTAAENAQISVSFDDGATTGVRPVPWTRSYYTWRFADNIGTVDLTAGNHVMTIRIETVGMVNLEYLTFVHN